MALVGSLSSGVGTCGSAGVVLALTSRTTAVVGRGAVVRTNLSLFSLYLLNSLFQRFSEGTLEFLLLFLKCIVVLLLQEFEN